MQLHLRVFGLSCSTRLVFGAVAVEAAVVGAEAGPELQLCLFVTGRAISGNEPTFSGFEASSVFSFSWRFTCFSVTGVARMPAFSM